MNKLLIASKNKGKIEEFKALLSTRYDVMSLDDVNIDQTAEEPFDTLEENAITKAEFYFEKTGLDCIADDSGLFVEELNGEPGVFSARYAGDQASAEDNMDLLLSKMKKANNRNAVFRAVIILKTSTELLCFEGEMHGQIIDEKRGDNGFGYDPVFVPQGYDLTNAELDSKVKNKISHRGTAVKKLFNYLFNEI